MITGNNKQTTHPSKPFPGSITSENAGKNSMKKDWTQEGTKPVLFLPDEIDLYVNKATLEAYIFHGKKIDYDSIDRLEYNPSDYSIDVVMKDGTVMDLGVKLQWLMRPYFPNAKEIMIVQTKDRKSIDGRLVPLIHKDKKTAKK